MTVVCTAEFAGIDQGQKAKVMMLDAANFTRCMMTSCMHGPIINDCDLGQKPLSIGIGVLCWGFCQELLFF